MKTPFFDKRGRLIQGTTVLTNFKAKDPTCADIAVPKAFKEIEARGGQAKAMCKEAGFSLAQIKSAWQFCLAFMLITISAGALPIEIQPGISFVDGQRLTAAQLTALVNQAAITPTFYTDKTLNTVLGTTDTILIYDSGSSTYKRITANNFLINNTNWFQSQLVEKTAPTTNDMFLIYDATGLTLAKTSLADIQIAPTALAWWSTNWQNVFYLGPTNATYPTNIIVPKTNISGADTFWIYDSVTTSNRSVTWQVASNNIATNFTLTTLTNYAPLDFGKNLLIYNTGTTTNAMTLTADELPLRSTKGLYILPKNVSLTNININLSGTNGLDAGTRTTNTWYYIYAISDGTNLFGLLSTNPTSPVLVTNAPTYPFCSRQLGAVWQATNTFITTYQSGQNVLITPTNIISVGPIPSAGSYIALPAANAATFITAVPPIAKSINGTLFSSAVAASGGFFIAANAAGFSPAQVVDPIAGAATASITWAQFNIQLTTTTNIFWKGATGTSGSNQITISGFGL